MAETYYCKRCLCNREAAKENGKDKVRGFRSGYVARYLQCRHTIPVTQPPAVSA